MPTASPSSPCSAGTFSRPGEGKQISLLLEGEGDRGKRSDEVLIPTAKPSSPCSAGTFSRTGEGNRLSQHLAKQSRQCLAIRPVGRGPAIGLGCQNLHPHIRRINLQPQREMREHVIDRSALPPHGKQRRIERRNRLHRPRRIRHFHHATE